MKSTSSWDITPCSSLKVNKTFRRNVSPPFSGSNKPSKIPAGNQLAICFHDGGDMFIRNVGWLSTGYTTCYSLSHCTINSFGRPKPAIFPLRSFSHDISSFRSLVFIVCFTFIIHSTLSSWGLFLFKWFYRLMNETSNGLRAILTRKSGLV
jgi:hypothetical protein